MAAYIDRLEEYYQTNNVYKCLVITGDDDETCELVACLKARNHSVCHVVEADLDDERPTRFNTSLCAFENGYRVIVVSYQVWFQMQRLLEIHVLPEQNLIVVASVSRQASNFIHSWLHDASQRGFILRDDCHVLALNADD